MEFFKKLFGGHFWGRKDKKRKLYLLLDLDLTLLNSIQLEHLTVEQEYLKANCVSLQDPKGSLFILEHMGLMTKLRPFVRKFLKEASKMFELYINTVDDRPHALQMAELLDPKDEYFGGRVISRHAHNGREQNRKNLDVLQGRENAVVILDDTEAVWEHHKDNLILMERYNFFVSCCEKSGYNGLSLSQLRYDEGELDGVVASILEVLRKIHYKYFKDCNSADAGSRDVKQVMEKIRKKVLKGVKIVFPTGFLLIEKHYLWKMAEQLGAECSTELDVVKATHVVSTDSATQLSGRVVKNKKFLINPQWIETIIVEEAT